jgi:hypothetical protein
MSLAYDAESQDLSRYRRKKKGYPIGIKFKGPGINLILSRHPLPLVLSMVVWQVVAMDSLKYD